MDKTPVKAILCMVFGYEGWLCTAYYANQNSIQESWEDLELRNSYRRGALKNIPSALETLKTQKKSLEESLPRVKQDYEFAKQNEDGYEKTLDWYRKEYSDRNYVDLRTVREGLKNEKARKQSLEMDNQKLKSLLKVLCGDSGEGLEGYCDSGKKSS